MVNDTQQSDNGKWVNMIGGAGLGAGAGYLATRTSSAQSSKIVNDFIKKSKQHIQDGKPFSDLSKHFDDVIEDNTIRGDVESWYNKSKQVSSLPKLEKLAKEAAKTKDIFVNNLSDRAAIITSKIAVDASMNKQPISDELIKTYLKTDFDEIHEGFEKYRNFKQQANYVHTTNDNELTRKLEIKAQEAYSKIKFSEITGYDHQSDLYKTIRNDLEKPYYEIKGKINDNMIENVREKASELVNLVAKKVNTETKYNNAKVAKDYIGSTEDSLIKTLKKSIEGKWSGKAKLAVAGGAIIAGAGGYLLHNSNKSSSHTENITAGRNEQESYIS